MHLPIEDRDEMGMPTLHEQSQFCHKVCLLASTRREQAQHSDEHWSIGVKMMPQVEPGKETIAEQTNESVVAKRLAWALFHVGDFNYLLFSARYPCSVQRY